MTNKITDFIDAVSNLNHFIRKLGSNCEVESITVSHSAYLTLENHSIKDKNDSYTELKCLDVKILRSQKPCVNHKLTIKAVTGDGYDFKCSVCEKNLIPTWKEA